MTTIIKKKAASEAHDVTKLNNLQLNFSTTGRKTRIIVNATEKKEIRFTEESLDDFRVNLGASTNKMRRITNFLRCNIGRKTIPVNYLQHMSDKSNILKKVVNCCFTSGKVGPSLDTYIRELDNSLKSIDNLSTTLKIHVILAHVIDSLKYIDNNNGLGFWSEQSGESVHREFLKFWERYKINSITDESYPLKLLKAVVEFSSLHI